MGDRRRVAGVWRMVGLLVALAALSTACGGSGSDGALRSPRPTNASPPATTPLTTTPATAASPTPVSPTTAPPPAGASPSAAPGAASSSGPAPAPAPAPSPVDRLVGVGSARQVISVVADDYGQTGATLVAYERDGAGWRQVFGPWSARVGTNGFAPPDAKREGDGRTPTGAYPFDFFFGILANPGVRYQYRDVTSGAIVWDDDSASARYNQWVDSSAQDPGVDPEPMYNPPAYNYGAVIAYNAARTPGLGSAIFLHVSTGGPTAGCVSLPQSQLVELLRWLDPALGPRIVMGTRAAVTS